MLENRPQYEATKKSSVSESALPPRGASTHRQDPFAHINDTENQIIELQMENKRLRESIQQYKANQKKMYSRWERVMVAVQQIFAPNMSSNSSNAAFDFSAFQSFMEGNSEASRRFFTSVESDIREMMSLARYDFDDSSDDVFSTLLSSPKRTGGGPLASINSFDSFASRVTPPFAPPVPKYQPEKETIGGEALSKQSSFELFSTYVSMYGQPVETSKVKKEENSGTKRVMEESTLPDSKRSRPFAAVDSTDDPFAAPPTNEHDPFSLDSNAARYNSMDFGASTRMNSMDIGHGLNGSDFSFSRLNSINSVDLNGLLGQLTRENSVDNEKRNI